MENCSKTRTLIDVNEVILKNQPIVCNLLAAHSLTGCDKISSFAGIGKTTVFNCLKSFTGIIKLGDPSFSEDEIVGSCLKFVCSLYKQNASQSLNDLRAKFSQEKLLEKDTFHQNCVLYHRQWLLSKCTVCEPITKHFCGILLLCKNL